MPYVYRLKGGALLSAFCWPVGFGGLLALTGFFWMNAGYDAVFSLRLLNDWVWLCCGVAVGLLLVVWLRQLRLEVDARGLRARNSLGLLRLPALDWPQARVQYRHRTRLGQVQSALCFTLDGGFQFVIGIGAAAIYLPEAGAPPLEQAVARCCGRIDGSAEAPPARQQELGPGAGLLSYAALLLAAGGFIMLAGYRAHYCDGAGRLWVLAALAIAAGGFAWRAQRPWPQPLAAGFISLLFLAAATFFGWSAGMSAAVALATPRPVAFELAEDTPQYQRWQSAEGVSLTIVADRAHQLVHGPAPVTLKVSTLLGISALTQDEYTRLVQLD